MAIKKISELNIITDVQNTDLLLVETSGGTRAANVENVFSNIKDLLQYEIDGKANKEHGHTASDLQSILNLYYTKTEIDSMSSVDHTHGSEDITFTDTMTGAQYRLYITNGKLNLVLDGTIPESAYPNGDEVAY